MLVVEEVLGLQPAGRRLHAAGRRRAPRPRRARRGPRGGARRGATYDSDLLAARGVRRAQRPRPGADRRGGRRHARRARCAPRRTRAPTAAAARTRRSAGWRRREVHRAAAHGDRAARQLDPRERGRRHRQDVGAGRALRAGRVRGRRGRGVDPRDHVHREGGRPAQAAGPRPLRRAERDRARARGRGGLDLHHPRLLRARAAHPRAGRRDRPRVPRARRRGGRAAGARRLRRRARRVPRARGERGAAADDRRLQPAPAGRHGAHGLRPPAQPGQGARRCR